MKRSNGNGQAGKNGNGHREPRLETAQLIGGISRMDLDRLFDDPSSPGVPAPRRAAAVPAEAAALFDEEEVASLFEDTTSDSVPRALVPSRLKPCSRVIIKPSVPRPRLPVAPTGRAAALPPRRSRRWPDLKPVLNERRPAAPVSTQQTLPPGPQVDPEDAPTIPALPPIPRLAVPLTQTKPGPGITPAHTPTLPLEPPAKEPEYMVSESQLPRIELEEQDTQPDIQAFATPTPTPAPTPQELPQIPNLEELDQGGPELNLQPEEALPDPDSVPAPVPTVEPTPAVEAAAPVPMPLPKPLMLVDTGRPTRPFVDPELTLKVMVNRPKQTWSMILPVGTFIAGAAVASLLFMVFTPLANEELEAKLFTPLGITTPAREIRPVSAPLAEPPSSSILKPEASAKPKPAPVAKSEPAPIAKPKPVIMPPAVKMIAAKEAPAKQRPAPAKVQLKTSNSPVSNAGLLVARTIKSCLSERALTYQKVGVRLLADGKVRRGFIGESRGVDSKTIACVKEKLAGLDVGIVPPRGGYVEWHLNFRGSEPTAWVAYPKDLRE